MLAAGDGDRLEAGVDVERPEHRADVVAHGLDAEVELLGDLLGRATVFEEPQHLRLARRQVRVRGRHDLLLDVDQLSEHADDAMPLVEAHGAHFDRDAVAVLLEQDDLSVDVLLADEVLGERLTRATCFLATTDVN